MPRIAGVPYRQAIRVLEKLGFRVVRQSGHVVLSTGEVTVTIPRHTPDMRRPLPETVVMR